MFRYIKPDEKDLVNYKYKGGSASLTYEYLWSPFANFLLKFVPNWVAPNLITLVAFLLVVLSHIVFVFEGNQEINQTAPRWKLFLFGLTMFIYQHLDNLDGKQARKTQSSSPVGMLFDHGADALTSILFGIQIIKVIRVEDPEFAVYGLAFIVMIPNFIALWVQYSVGEFILDRINPIDQGIPSYVLLSWIGCIADYSFWNKHHIFTSYNYEFLLAFSVVTIIICSKMCKDIFKGSSRSKRDVLQKIWLVISFLTVLFAIKFFGLTEIYNRHFYAFAYILLSFWGRNMMLIQVAAVTNQKYNVFNKGTNFFLMAMTILILRFEQISAFLKEYLIIVGIIQFLILLEFVYSFLNQAAAILNIKIFKLNHLGKIRHE